MFFPSKMVNGSDVEKFLIRVNPGIIDRSEEQDSIWTEFDQLGEFEQVIATDEAKASPPTPQDFATWFETKNSVDLRRLLRDIEIVLIEAAMSRNNNNTSEAAKDLKLLRTTLIEKVKKYGL